MRRFRASVLTLCAVGALSSMIAGCQPPQTTMTPKEISAFKGGPMPASAARIMAEQMRLANERQAAKNLKKH